MSQAGAAADGHARAHPPPPFDAWLWWRAWQETWLAGLAPRIAQMQRAARLAALLQAALGDSPLYRARARAAGRSGAAPSLRDFAPIGKAELMQHFDGWSTDRRVTHEAAAQWLARDNGLADGWFGRYLLWTSSGTSGVPGWFVQDAASLAAFDAIDALRLRGAAPVQALQPALGTWGLGRRFAFVGASGGHFAGIVSLTRLARIVPPPFAPQLALLSVQQPLREIAAQLERHAPDVLITYPSVAEALAQMQRRGELRLPLSEAWLGGEQLSAAQQRDVAATFGCTVRNNYGASECFSIAWQCEHGTLHVHDDWVILEPVDERLRPVPPGVLSASVLLTNLANRMQPLIRYRLDDRVRVLERPCACGSPFTAIEVQGRSGDTLHLPALDGAAVANSRGAGVPIVPLALETAIEEGAGLTQFQIIERERGGRPALEVRFEAAVAEPRQAFRRCSDAIGRYLATQGVKKTPCRYCAEPPLREPASGKLRRVLRARA